MLMGFLALHNLYVLIRLTENEGKKIKFLEFSSTNKIV